MIRVASLALASLTSGCMFSSAACDMVVTPAITLAVLDASSGLRIPGASAEATKWTSHFTFTGESATQDLELHGSAGTYTVTVRQVGYLDWVQAGVTVRESGGACPGPTMESLDAELVAAAPG